MGRDLLILKGVEKRRRARARAERERTGRKYKIVLLLVVKTFNKE